MHKQVRKLVREIEANGFTVAKAGRGGHAKVYNSEGGTVAVLPISPQRRGRWEQNLRAELRRRGVLPS